MAKDINMSCGIMVLQLLNIWEHWLLFGVKYPIILKKLLIYICDVELVGQNYYWALCLTTQISHDKDMTCNVMTKYCD